MPKGAKVKDIAKITGMANQSVSNCLWKLKDEGKIERVDGVYRINGSVLTDVNKPVEKAPPLETNDESQILTIGKVTKALAKENERLRSEVGSMERSWREARQSSLEFERLYFDALAVIKYLEAK
jgi:predicted transcriptional regulator